LNATLTIRVMTIIPYLLISLQLIYGFDFNSMLFLLASRVLLQLHCATLNVTNLFTSFRFFLLRILCLLLVLSILLLLLPQCPLLVSSVMTPCILLQLVPFCFEPSPILLLSASLFTYCKISILLLSACLPVNDLLLLGLLTLLLTPVCTFMLFLLTLLLLLSLVPCSHLPIP